MYTQQTTNYQLPQFIGTDYVDIVADFNPAFETIDTTMHDNQIKIDGAVTTATDAATVAQSAMESAQDADTTAKSLEAEVVALKQFEGDTTKIINTHNGGVPIRVWSTDNWTSDSYTIDLPLERYNGAEFLVRHKYGDNIAWRNYYIGTLFSGVNAVLFGQEGVAEESITSVHQIYLSPTSDNTVHLEFRNVDQTIYKPSGLVELYIIPPITTIQPS